MGLVPQVTAITELDAADDIKSQLSSDIDLVGRGVVDGLQRIKALLSSSPIVSVEFLGKGNSRRLHLTCEESTLTVETSLETSEVKIYE